MFNPRRFFYKAVAISESVTTSDEKLPLFENAEKDEHVIGSISSPPEKLWIKYRKLPFIVKLLFLTFAFAFALFSGKTIIDSAIWGYDVILPRIMANGHAVCNQEAIVNDDKDWKPIFLPNAIKIKHDGWHANCSSKPDDECQLAIAPGATFWQSSNDAPAGGHTITITLKEEHPVQVVAVKPQDSVTQGLIYKHRVEVSKDGTNWELVAFGTWGNFNSEKYAVFEPRQAKHVRLTATVKPTETAKFITISSFNIYELKRDSVSVAERGEWGSTIDFPLVPVTAWVDPKSHTVVTMSSFKVESFGGENHWAERWTYSATWRPGTELVEENKISQTAHDMFCPGTSFNAKGDVFVTGGATSQAFSIYSTKDSTKESSWSPGPELQEKRGYHGQTYLPDGRTFMIGGTWGTGTSSADKNGEIFAPNASNPSTGSWSSLPNCAAKNIKMDLIKDCPKVGGQCNDKDEWQQHHPWLFAWKGGRVFHAGPSKQMNWFDTTPKGGAVTSAGLRGDDGDAVCGIAVMYDAAKGVILTAGGAPNYHYWFNSKFQGPRYDHRKPATTNAFEITITEDNIDKTVTPIKVASMTYPRIFANAVILPTGETFVVGGEAMGEPFFDRSWQPVPELYTTKGSTTEKEWKEMAPHSIPRGYHSWALLLPDATVLVGGGGLSEAQGNHWDAQIYRPRYLFDANGKLLSSRPKITPLTKKEYSLGEQITFKTDGAVKGASLIRYSAATHALNNDLRRIALNTTSVGNPSDYTYNVTIPEEKYVALPGYWMLFVLRDGVVPSEAETIRIKLPGETSSFTNENA